MDHHLEGAALYEISDFYRITAEEATAAVDYINSHLTELMPTYRQMLERDSQGNSPEVTELFRRSHEKFVELQTGLKGRTEDASVTG